MGSWLGKWWKLWDCEIMGVLRSKLWFGIAMAFNTQMHRDLLQYISEYDPPSVDDQICTVYVCTGVFRTQENQGACQFRWTAHPTHWIAFSPDLTGSSQTFTFIQNGVHIARTDRVHSNTVRCPFSCQ